MMSLCARRGPQPALSNAAAISMCPLTPCSRKIAMRGRAPPMSGARRRSGIELSSGVIRIGRIEQRSYSSRAHAGWSRRLCS